MVRLLKLSNYKSYGEALLKFCPGVNGIIGLSQSGKTNILRSIRLLNFLRPTGYAFVHKKDYSKSSFIKVKTFEGNSVSLRKGKGVGTYRVNGKPLRKLKKKVPEEVANILNLSEINFHNQLDTPFLVISKPSEISRTINTLTGMDDFDTWINEANARVREFKKNKDYYEKELEIKTIEHDKLDGLEDIESALIEAETCRKERLELEREYETVSDISAHVTDLEKRLKVHRKLFKLEPQIDEIVECRKEIEDLNDQADAIEAFLEKKKEITIAKKMLRDQLTEFIAILKEAGKCPTCLSLIEDETIEKIEDEILAPFRYPRNG